MTLTESVATAIKNWPTLFGCRTDVLHQYFCVNGNGMEWQGGVLVDHSPSFRERSPYEDEEAKVAELRKMFHTVDTEQTQPWGFFVSEEEARVRLNVRRHNEQIRFRITNADMLALMAWNFDHRLLHEQNPYPPSRIYPLCQYACMNEVPDDVQPDWLAGVREMIFCVFRSNPATASVRPEHAERQHADNLAFADHVLQSLHARFGSPKGEATSLVEFREIQARNKAALHRMLNRVLKASD